MSVVPISSSALRPAIRRHLPVVMLVLACLFWGMGFSWAKNAGDAVNRVAGVELSAPVGHLTQLAIRFSVAAILWLTCQPALWRGWSVRAAGRGVVIGLSLSLGLILQHVGLGLSDEAVIAFLTNLTVIFVPAWVLIAGQRRPRRGVMIAVPIALLGTALMSGLGGGGVTGGLSSGTWWGAACAAAFAAEILLLDRLSKGESATRITFLLFLTAAVTCWATAVCLPGFKKIQWQTLASGPFLLNLMPSVLLTTLVSFGLMTVYQPKVEPSRAAVIYLCEPLFAAGFAWAVNGRTMTGMALIGAGLILLANVVAEWRGPRV